MENANTTAQFELQTGTEDFVSSEYCAHYKSGIHTILREKTTEASPMAKHD